MTWACSKYILIINYECWGADPEVVEKPGDMSLSKLKNLYTQAKELAETEMRYVVICI